MGVREFVVGRITFNPSKMGYAAEKQLAKRLRARTVPGSGSTDNAKGDIVKDDVLLEVKSTTCASFSVKLADLNTIRREALNTGKIPALAVMFTTGYGRPRTGGSWVMVPEHIFKEWTDA